MLFQNAISIVKIWQNIVLFKIIRKEVFKMTKKSYSRPQIVVVNFQRQDVIVAGGCMVNSSGC